VSLSVLGNRIRLDDEIPIDGEEQAAFDFVVELVHEVQGLTN
jgi:hypothetical protein